MLPLHQDGSTHEWLAGQPPLDRVVALDDAPSEIHAAPRSEGGTFLSSRALAAVIERHGLFGSLDTDRGDRSFVDPTAGRAVAGGRLTPRSVTP